MANTLEDLLMQGNNSGGLERLAQMFIMNQSQRQAQPQQPRTVNIGGQNILDVTPRNGMNAINESVIPGLAQLAQGYLMNQQMDKRQQFNKELGDVLTNTQDPEEQIKGIMQVGAKYGGFMGQDDKVKMYIEALGGMTKRKITEGKEDARLKRNDLVDSTKIREEFINRPEVKEYITVNTSVKSMDSLLKNAKSGNIQNKVALDQALVTMYNKLTDPNSVVRESEYARTAGNLPLMNRFSGALEKVQKGGAGLTDSDRDALVWGAKVIADERGKTYSDTLKSYTDLSNQYGIEPSLITRGLPEHKAYNATMGKSAPGQTDIKAQYNALRSQGVPAQEAKKRLGL